ncbi:MAG: pantoate--beta-alanine ligase [Rubricoccaceae bacterium]|nr:pantoate--beta-alanine ligase [Rubricoccaceae bacterium]
MERFHTVAAMQAHADTARAAGQRLALVPTMGALHEGHLALVEAAKQRADHVTVSIFVNPTQFAPGEDYARYPRTLDADAEALADAGGVDVVFAPDAEEVYPFGLPPYTTVGVRDLDRHLCGAFRPGHFEGVATVVAKLFLACRPHLAVFGEKDAQQLAILRRMTAELRFGIEVVGHPIVREADGLALSSRNRYLTDEERRQAVVLSEALAVARAAVDGGERRAAPLVDAMREAVARAPLARLQYAEVVDAETLQPVEVLAPGRYLAALAAHLGGTRLIDNTTLEIGPDGLAPENR